MRADARRNYDLILAAAEVEVARSGAEASLEKIARDAGVGSATLHRHFPSRRALLEAVFHDRVETLCIQARELGAAADSGRALADWIRAVTVYGATTRGLAASLLAATRDKDDSRAAGDKTTGDKAAADRAAGDRAAGDRAAGEGAACEVMLREAGGELIRRAQEAGAVRPGVGIDDLLTMANAVSLATEDGPTAARLVTLAMDGIY